MRVWLYGRLSKDDDPQMDSLENQLRICQTYADSNDCTVVGKSTDDNISGMRFDRAGLEKITDAVASRLVDAILVKDLSRLGRHNVQASLYIDFLRQRGVAVISVTEGLNTLVEEDDLIIGIRSLLNDLYAKDIGNKIRHGYREKQKIGLVISPPFGYWKDRNTNCIRILEDAAETVRMIYELYLQGCGQKEIARRLNSLGRKTPAEVQAERHGEAYHVVRRADDGKCIWNYASVKNILSDESYAGVLTNHKREVHAGRSAPVEVGKQFRHEGFYPMIVTREEWDRTQCRLRQTARAVPGNKSRHRYAGLLCCGECGNGFVPMIRTWSGKQRVEYVCGSYHRGGKGLCSSHRIHEEVLNQRIFAHLQTLRDRWEEELTDLVRQQNEWRKQQPRVMDEIEELRREVAENEEMIEELLLLKMSIARR